MPGEQDADFGAIREELEYRIRQLAVRICRENP
jgi:hypothetical protein